MLHVYVAGTVFLLFFMLIAESLAFRKTHGCIIDYLINSDQATFTGTGLFCACQVKLRLWEQFLPLYYVLGPNRLIPISLSCSAVCSYVRGYGQ